MGLKLIILRLVFFIFGVIFYFHIKILFIEWNIIIVNGAAVIMTFLVDWIRLLFSRLVMMISSVVFFYRYYYMEAEKFYYRFMILVYFFVLSMILIIFRPNLISILLGWDGLGLVSYCLVIYYQNFKSANAGLVTILSNRIGDVAILLAIAWAANYGRWNFFFFQFIFSVNRNVTLITLIIVAALTKRAQMPFSAWLPAAIAAPTPVSALVHSSTLVTAGVYLLIRFNFFLGVNKFLLYIGLFTIFISGCGANFENDLKKIIALSTLRQLGLIIFTLRLGLVEFSFFHLFTHALFKSLLFLCAGTYIHSYGDIQDIRFISGLMVSFPATSFYFICASLALCGFPFLSGFYSKDLILELFFSGNINFFVFFIGVVATLLTATYSLRLVFYIFNLNIGGKLICGLKEEVGIIAPIRFLFFYTIVMGGWIVVLIIPTFLIFLPFIIKLIILFLILVVRVFLSVTFFISKLFIYYSYSSLIKFLGTIWFLVFLTRNLFTPLNKYGLIAVKLLDQGWLELLGGQGIYIYSSSIVSRLDLQLSINIKFYLFLFIIFIFILLVLIYLNSLIKALYWSCKDNFVFLGEILKITYLINENDLFLFKL